MRAPETGPNPFHEHIPLQVLAMAGWAGLWMLFEALLSGHGLEGRRQLGPFLAVLAAAGAAAALAVPGWLFRLLTSVRFALAQGGVLIAAVLLSMAAERWNGPAPVQGPQVFRSLWFCSLLAVLAASTLAVAWKRRPYTPARLGFLLVHVAPSLVLLGLLCARWLIQAGFASLLLGCAWMFYLKPVLKRREARP